MILREAVANLIKVKGRHNTEIAYQKLVKAFDADEPEVCCQDFEHCNRSCTPRGQWLAQKEAQREWEWQGLTDEEISAIDWKQNETLHDFARAIEAKLRGKNGV